MDDFIDVYSYARISHPSQIEGRGLSRHDERLDHYLATRPNCRLVQRMQDITSGWSGLHRSKGTFGAFETLVDQGLIKPGSRLALDKLDRLSREDTDVALELLLKLIRKRVVVVTLSDGMEYTKTMGRAKLFEGLLRALIAFEVANGESDKKSDNHLHNWKTKRKDLADNGTRLTRMGPGWQDPREPGDGDCPAGLLQNQRWRENDHAHTVREMFRLCAKGWGATRIIKEMDRQGRLSPSEGKRKGGGGWAPTSVRRLLTDRAVIGEFQSEKVGLVEGYYTATVDAELWALAQAALLRRREGTTIREQEHVNVFSGFSYCACCSSPIIRATGSAPRQRERLICSSKQKTGRCKLAPSHAMGKTIRALHTVLAGQFEVKPRSHSGLDQQIALARLDLNRAQNAVDALFDAFGASPSPAARAGIERAEARLLTCKRAIEDLDRRLVLERGEVDPTDAMRILIGIVEAAAAGDEDARADAAKLLRSVVEGAVFYPDREIVVVMRSGVACGIQGGAGLWWRWPTGDTTVNLHAGIKPGFKLNDAHVTMRTAETRKFLAVRANVRWKSAAEIGKALSQITHS